MVCQNNLKATIKIILGKQPQIKFKQAKSDKSNNVLKQTWQTTKYYIGYNINPNIKFYQIDFKLENYIPIF